MVQVSTNIIKTFFNYTTRSFLFGQNIFKDFRLKIIIKYYFSNFKHFLILKGYVFERNL